MKLAIPVLLVAMTLSACGDPEVAARRRANLAVTNTALESAKTVEISGQRYRVAHVTERNQALVKPLGQPAAYFPGNVEAAARAATGCPGTLDLGILAGLETPDLNLAELRTKISGRFNGWSVRLSC